LQPRNRKGREKGREKRDATGAILITERKERTQGIANSPLPINNFLRLSPETNKKGGGANGEVKE